MTVGPGSVYASGSPFYHIAGLGNLAVMVAVGATVLPFPRFGVDAWQDLGSHGVTHAFLVPTMIERLLDASALTIPGLRLLQHGSAPIRPAMLARGVRAAWRAVHQHVRPDRGVSDRLPGPRGP